MNIPGTWKIERYHPPKHLIIQYTFYRRAGMVAKLLERMFLSHLIRADLTYYKPLFTSSRHRTQEFALEKYVRNRGYAPILLPLWYPHDLKRHINNLSKRTIWTTYVPIIYKRTQKVLTIPGVHHILYDVFNEPNLTLGYAACRSVEHWHYNRKSFTLLLIGLGEIFLCNSSRPFDAVSLWSRWVAHIGDFDQHSPNQHLTFVLHLNLKFVENWKWNEKKQVPR